MKIFITLLGVMLVGLQLGASKETFRVLIFGGYWAHRVRIHDLSTQGFVCYVTKLNKGARSSPFGSIINGNVTLCGGGMKHCTTFNKDMNEWDDTSLEMSRYYSSSVTTFDRKSWTFFGGKSSTMEVWEENKNEFEEMNFGFDLKDKVCSTRYNQTHAIVSQGTTKVFWYEESGSVVTEWKEKDTLTARSSTGCGLVFNEEQGYQFVIAGGYVLSEETEASTVRVFSFDSNSWILGKYLPDQLKSPGYLQYQNQFLFIGGYVWRPNTRPINFEEVYKYDFEEGWLQLPMELDGDYGFGAFHLPRGTIDC